jgi:hypothetical protein
MSYKIIVKVLTNRLNMVLEKAVSESRNALEEDKF